MQLKQHLKQIMMHNCVSRPQWVNLVRQEYFSLSPTGVKFVTWEMKEKSTDIHFPTFGDYSGATVDDKRPLLTTIAPFIVVQKIVILHNH